MIITPFLAVKRLTVHRAETRNSSMSPGRIFEHQKADQFFRARLVAKAEYEYTAGENAGAHICSRVLSQTPASVLPQKSQNNLQAASVLMISTKADAIVNIWILPPPPAQLPIEGYHVRETPTTHGHTDVTF